MRQEDYTLNVVQNGPGPGSLFTTRHFVDKWIQVHGIAGGCVLQVLGTLDGSNFVQSGANITADGAYEIPEGFISIEINRSVQGTGNPTVAFTGRNERAS